MQRIKIFTLFFSLFSFINSHAQQPKLVPPVGHTSAIDYVDYSPDGKYVVTASGNTDDRVARVWEVASGKLIHTLQGHSQNINNVQYSKNGKYIFTDAFLPILWDARTGELLSVFDTIPGNNGIMSPDGKYIAVSPKFGSNYIDTVLVYDAESRKELYRFGGDRAEYEQLLFSPDGQKIITWIYYDNTLEDTSKLALWDIKTGKKDWEKKIERTTINNIRFSNNGKYLVMSSDKEVHLFDVATGTENEDFFEFEHGSFTDFLFSHDDRLLVSSDRNYNIYISDIQQHKLLHTLEGHNHHISGMIITPDGEKIISVSYDSTMIVWDVKTGKKIHQAHAHQGWVNGISISPTGKDFTTVSYDNKANVWSLADYSLQKTLRGTTSNIELVKFSPDNLTVIITDSRGFLKILDIASGKLLHTLTGHSGQISNFLISSNSKRILSWDYDTTLRVWDTQTGKELYTRKGEEYNFYNAAIHPSSLYFVTWEAIGHKLSFWDLKTGTKKNSLVLPPGSFIADALTFTADGKFLLLNKEGNVEVREAGNGKLLKTLPGSKANISKITTSNDGKLLAAIADTVAVIWNLATGSRMHIIKGTSRANAKPDATYSFNSVQFSPDNKKIITSSDDGAARIFDVVSGRQIMMLDNKGYSRVIDARYTNNGKSIVTIEKDYYTRVWDASSGEPISRVGSATENLGAADIHQNSNYLAIANGSRLMFFDIKAGNILYSTFFINNDDWLVIDSSDRYDGTEAARKLLYFTCNDEIIELDQVKDQLWVPNLAERIIKGESITSKTLTELNICGLTPQIENRSGATGYHFIITPRRGGLGETVLLVNGIEVRRYAADQLTKKENAYELKVNKDDIKDFLIAGQENNVSVKSFTTGNAISSRGLIINEEKSKLTAAAPNLYAVMVGVSDYKGDELDLKYAAKDATDISNAVSGAAKKLLNTDGKEHVFMYNLTTAKERYQLPGKNSIKKILEEIGKKATANDILLIFFAGHGVMTGDDEKKQFYFLTADASTLSSTSAVKDVGISTTELVEWMKPQNIKAQKRILIFDACNSGQAINDIAGKELGVRNDDKAQQIKAIDKLNEKSGLFILSASASNQSAYEMGRYSQGLLTYSLLKAIKQRPDILEDGKYLNVSSWFNAAEKTVSEISKENGARQEPQIVTNTNFNIGMVDEEVMAKIVLPQEKPLFAASNFQNSDEAIADDDLELSKLINLQLSDIAARGTESKIVYVTATNSPDAYSLSGRYTIKGDAITVTVNIKQNKTIKSKFEVSGTKDKLSELAASIADKAAGMAK